MLLYLAMPHAKNAKHAFHTQPQMNQMKATARILYDDK